MSLTMAGYEAKLFTDPETFLHDLGAMDPAPDLLVTDYQMPRMNGLMLIQAAKRFLPELRTISLSGTLHVSDIKEADCMPDVSVPKPFRQAELLAAVRKALAK